MDTCISAFLSNTRVKPFSITLPCMVRKSEPLFCKSETERTRVHVIACPLAYMPRGTPGTPGRQAGCSGGSQQVALRLGQAGTRAQAPGTSLRDTRGFEMESKRLLQVFAFSLAPLNCPSPLPYKRAVVKMQVGPPSWVEIAK